MNETLQARKKREGLTMSKIDRLESESVFILREPFN